MTETFEDALELFEQHRADWLAAARSWARSRAKTAGIITINDIRRDGPPIPEGVDPRVAGAVFAEKGVWENVGYGRSARRTSHGRPVARWRLVGS